MTFTVYIRLMMTSYQYLLLCSLSEVYNFNSSTRMRLISLIIAYLFMASCHLFYIFAIYQVKTTKRWSDKKNFVYIRELFSGMKENDKAKAYSVLLLTRRLFLCVILVFLQDLHFMVRVVSFVVIQISYFILIILIRPFVKITNNIVEIVNEAMMTTLILMLLYFNEPSRWNQTIEKAMMDLMMYNSILV